MYICLSFRFHSVLASSTLKNRDLSKQNSPSGYDQDVFSGPKGVPKDGFICQVTLPTFKVSNALSDLIKIAAGFNCIPWVGKNFVIVSWQILADWKNTLWSEDHATDCLKVSFKVINCDVLAKALHSILFKFTFNKRAEYIFWCKIFFSWNWSALL